jgi:4-amino-4-deoxy-L-arabinose transferase-like glycosyltransferase
MPMSSVVPRRDGLIFAGLILLAVLLIALNPLGFFGGNWDDGRYLDSVRAWADHGPVLGTNHWSLRWPLILPTTLSTHIFGVTRAGLMVVPLCYFAALIVFNFWAVRRAFGVNVAAMAVFAVITTPEMMLWATRLNVDVPELLFWSISLWSLHFAAARDAAQRRWLVLCGLSAGFAWATRETSLGLAVILVTAFLTGRGLTGAGPDRRSWWWVVLGAASIILPEMLILWHTSGDIMYRVHVDLSHTLIPSNDMVGKVAIGQTAPLNVNVMQRWTGSGPLHLHWFIDPWVNFFLNYKFGFMFVLAGAIMWRARVDDRRALRCLAFIALINVITILYVIGADPKVRMFMPAILAASCFVAIAAPKAGTGWTRWFLLLCFALKLVTTFIELDRKTNFANVVGMTEAAIARAARPNEAIYADKWVISHLALADATLGARLVTGIAPKGGLQLTIGRIGDKTEDGASPKEGRWAQLMRARSDQRPVSDEIALRIGLVRQRTHKGLIVTLYRRTS